MISAYLAAVTAALLFAAGGPRLGRRLAPGLAAHLLTAASVVIAVSTAAVLAFVAFIRLAQLPAVAAYGDWSVQTLRSSDPLPAVVDIVSGLLLLASAGRVTAISVGRVRALWSVRRACHRQGGRGGLIVVDSDRAEAFATPSAGGRIVVTTGLLRALAPDERRALLAHEASHLAHRHAWFVLAADLAAAANPLLRATAREVGHAVERWADEDAAGQVGDRRVVARALARAALHSRAQRPVAATLPAVGGQLPDRVQALLTPPPRPRNLLPAVALLVLLLTSAVAALVVGQRSDALFDNASIEQSASDDPAHRHLPAGDDPAVAVIYLPRADTRGR